MRHPRLLHKNLGNESRKSEHVISTGQGFPVVTVKPGSARIKFNLYLRISKTWEIIFTKIFEMRPF